VVLRSRPSVWSFVRRLPSFCVVLRPSAPVLLCGPSSVGSSSVRVATVKPMADIDPDTAEKTARQLLDTRITAVRELAARRADLTHARDNVTTAERADTAAWANAEKAGWTETELRQVGFPAPGRRPPGRPRKPTDT